MASASVDNTTIRVRFLYVLTILLFSTPLFFSGIRLWGVESWKYFHPITVVGIIVCAVLVLVFEIRLSKVFATNAPASRLETIPFSVIAVVIGLTFLLLHILLSSRSHFLGDGYALLKTLSSSAPLIKGRGYGEGLAHLLVRNMFGGATETAALRSYQIIAVGSGALFSALSAYLSYYVMDNQIKRLLLLLALVTGGYTLLFYGYVENYALFLLSVLVFAIAGYRIVHKQWSKWLIVPVLVLTVFFHVLGLVLLLPASYVMLRGTRIGSGIRRLRTATKTFLVIVMAALFACAVGYQVATDYYSRFMIVSLFDSVFVPDSYTLFSGKHLLDLANLMFLLVPGVLLFIPSLRKSIKSKVYRDAPVLFLLLMTLGAWIAVFIVDPELGMPRDWDLLSFAGLPTVILLFYLAISDRSLSLVTVILPIFLSLMSVVSRAAILHVPSLGEKQIIGLLSLDSERSRSGLTLLREYYESRGDSTEAAKWNEETKIRFPGLDLIYAARALSEQGRNYEAKGVLSTAIRHYGGLADAWLMLSQCYVAERNYDSALISARISDGLNPYNPATREQIAFAYFMLQRYDKSRDIWLDLSASDTTWANPLYGLACVAKRKGDNGQYLDYLKRAEQKASAPPQFSLELGDYFLSIGQLQQCANAYKRALLRGINPKLIEERTSRNPQLRQWLDS